MNNTFSSYSHYVGKIVSIQDSIITCDEPYSNCFTGEWVCFNNNINYKNKIFKCFKNKRHYSTFSFNHLCMGYSDTEDIRMINRIHLSDMSIKESVLHYSNFGINPVLELEKLSNSDLFNWFLNQIKSHQMSVLNLNLDMDYTWTYDDKIFYLKDKNNNYISFFNVLNDRKDFFCVHSLQRTYYSFCIVDRRSFKIFNPHEYGVNVYFVNYYIDSTLLPDQVTACSDTYITNTLNNLCSDFWVDVDTKTRLSSGNFLLNQMKSTIKKVYQHFRNFF